MSKIKHPELKDQGKMNLEIAELRMGALMEIRKQFEQNKPFSGIRIGLALHITKETGVLVRTLRAGGAEILLASCNPLSTQDDVAAALATEDGIEVYGYKGENTEEYYEYIRDVIEAKPHITIDDGCDLVSVIHKDYPDMIPGIYGGCEETTTGIHRLKAMEKDNALKYPIIAVNDNKTKHLMDNYYGTGQSTLDGILRSTNILYCGKTVVVIGYGSCGKGVAMRAKGMGANVIVTEVDNFCALQARMDGFRVMKMEEAAKEGEIFVTVTGNKHVISLDHIKLMKHGTVLANSGHFDNEIHIDALENYSEKKRRVRHFLDEYTLPGGNIIYVAGEGRLVNLASAEGHPSEVMSLSFCGQVLACKYIFENKGALTNKVHILPESIDDYIAGLQLKAMDITIDKLTEEQIKYMSSWDEGT